MGGSNAGRYSFSRRRATWSHILCPSSAQSSASSKLMHEQSRTVTAVFSNLCQMENCLARRHNFCSVPIQKRHRSESHIRQCVQRMLLFRKQDEGAEGFEPLRKKTQVQKKKGDNCRRIFVEIDLSERWLLLITCSPQFPGPRMVSHISCAILIPELIWISHLTRLPKSETLHLAKQITCFRSTESTSTSQCRPALRHKSPRWKVSCSGPIYIRLHCMTLHHHISNKH